jgi:outer membrane protein TolC
MRRIAASILINFMHFPPATAARALCKRTILPLALFVVSIVSSRAGEAPTSLSAYLERAQTANPDLQAFSARYEAARERIPQAAALPDPMLQITHFVESVQTRTGPQENILMLSQRVPWFGRLSGRADAASAEAEAIHYAFQARQLMVARMVGTGFYDYAYNGKAIELTTQNLALLERLDPQVEERARTGGNLNGLLRIRVEIGKLRDRLASLQQQRLQLSARLAALLDLSGGETLPWPEWTPDAAISNAKSDAMPDAASLLAAIDANNPEVLMLQRKIASARARVELARLETRPDFNLGVTYIQVGDPVVNQTTPDAGRDPWGVTLSVNFPIWNRTSAARREATATQRAGESELDDRRNQLRADALVALSALGDARRRVRLYENDLLPLAHQAVENTVTGYQGGSATLLDLIDSQRSQLGLELEHWRARADAAQQQIILQTLANQPL